MDDWAESRQRAVERKQQLKRERAREEAPIPIKVCGGGPADAFEERTTDLVD